MKKFLLFLSVFASLTIFGASAVNALTFESKENVNINKNILDDAYIFAGNANIDANVFGDLVISGGTITINGNIHEDLTVAGAKVTIMGDVNGDLRIAGGQVSIFGNVGDDVIVAGGTVEIGKSSQVVGSVIAGAGILNMDGVVTEDIKGGMGLLTINGMVEGDVDVAIEDALSISDQAIIGGDLKYSAIVESDIPAQVVKGEILFNKFERESLMNSMTSAYFLHKLISYLSSLLILLLLMIFAPKIIIKTSKIAQDQTLKAFGYGIVALLAILIVPILLMASIVGIPLGLILFAVLVILYFFTKIIVAAWISGYFLNYRKKHSKPKIFGVLAAILLVYYIVGAVPFIGWLINLVLFIIGFGIIVLMKGEYYTFLKKKNMV